jgi:hypothetical protein
VLLLSGGLDPVTPPEWADAVARALPNAVHVVEPGAGHAQGGACTRALAEAVVRAGDARGLRTGLPRACAGAELRPGALAAGALPAGALPAGATAP